MSDHAVERYQERVKPAFSPDPPKWLTVPGHERVDGYLTICHGAIVFPVFRRSVTTCLTRSGVGEETRARRNSRKQGRRAYRRVTASPMFGRVARREDKAKKSKGRRVLIDLNEMAPADAGTAPEARPMEVGRP